MDADATGAYFRAMSPEERKGFYRQASSAACLLACCLMLLTHAASPHSAAWRAAAHESKR